MKEGEWDQVNKQELVEALWKRARYAVNSYSKSLIYETLGALKMAVQLKAVSSQEVRDIEQYLIHDHLNNGRYMTQVYRRWE